MQSCVVDFLFSVYLYRAKDLIERRRQEKEEQENQVSLEATRSTKLAWKVPLWFIKIISEKKGMLHVNIQIAPFALLSTLLLTNSVS